MNSGLQEFTTEQFRDWFVTGVQAMSGEHGDNLSQAFEPVAHRIGYSREYDWVDNLVKVIQELAEDQKQKCFDGIRQGLSIMANDVNETNFTSLSCALSIARVLGAHGACTIKDVSDRVMGKNTSLDDEKKKHLLSICGLCLFETDMKERDTAKPLLMRILKELDLEPRQYPRDRLIGFGVNPDEIPTATESSPKPPAP